MTAGEYRIIYFAPDPFLGTRLPVAALLRTPDGVKAVTPSRLPDAECAGGPDLNFLLRVGLHGLAAGADIGQLPAGLGPHFILAGDVRGVPTRVSRPEAWLEEILSVPHHGSGPKKGIRVATEGRQFLRMWGVDDKVQNRFEPAGHLLSRFAGRLAPITHYVLGRQLLLLEPIPAKVPKARIQEISTRFGAYKQALKEQPPGVDYSLVGYVLPGCSDKPQRTHVTTEVAFADAVLDARNEDECRELVRQIQAAA